jgi:hypothetical protein
MKSFGKPSTTFLGGLSVALLGLLSMTAAHAQLDWNFSNDTGSTIQFNGAAGVNSPAGAVGSFQFNPGTSGTFTGSQWTITSVDGGLTGDSVGLQGSITPPTGTAFYYGAITTNGALQTANILSGSTMGTLKIFDGSGYLTGTVDMETISTYTQAFGGLNDQLQINLTNLSYSGTDSDLESMVASQPGTLAVTFQFSSPRHTLTELSTGTRPFTTSYAGSISEVPEPSTEALMLGGLACLVLFRWRIRRA